VQCFVGSIDDATACVLERVRSEEGGYACLCNVHVLVTAQHDPELRRALNRAWTVFPDGFPVAWLARRAERDAARVAGADLMDAVLGAGGGLRHFLLGSTPTVLEALRARYGDAIVGTLSPPFGTIGAEVIDEIRSAEPDVIWCGLGAPKQEMWMAEHAEDLAPAVLLGVGAAFDFTAGTKKRAPVWMQRSSLEWAHRLASEPRRLAGRYARTNTEFIVRAGVELARRRSV
jgi:N-acetylglucosaminyldiphosphoundecaprenol N-acetyl-beta-D-mannosaminyltransferase